MYKNCVWETLQAVEQVEVSFKQTLKNIKNINNRYKMVSALKRKAQKRQDAFEAEIHAAITQPSCSKASKVSKKASRNKSKKHKGIRKAKRNSATKIFQGMEYIESPFLLPPTSSEEDISKMDASFLCVQTNCMYEIHETTTQLVARKPYQNFIRRLYRAARQKSQKDSRMREQDQDQALCPDCSIPCSCSGSSNSSVAT